MIENLDIIIDEKVNISVKTVFKNKAFFILWLGQFISNTGSNLSLIVLPLFIFYYTGSTTWLGIISLAEIIPVLIFSPIAGVFVDNHNRKSIIIWSDILNTLFILLVPVFIAFDESISENYVLFGITLVVFLGATVNRFFRPAREASIPQIVKSDEVSFAVTISKTTFNIIFL